MKNIHIQTDKKTVLIAEDESAMLDALTDKFKKEGFKVIKAHDGEEALNLASKHQPDLLMLDILMPKIDGITVMKSVRRMGDWGSVVPMIVLTNLNDHESMSEAAANQVYFLVKTEWKLDDVIKLAKEKLER